MKNSRYVLVAVAGLFASIAVARADSDSDSPEDTVPLDKDGIPLAVLKPRAPQLTADEIAAIRKQQAQAAIDKDWLLRGYERQLHLNASAKPGDDQSANLYYQISSDQGLSQLAGLPEMDDSSDGKPGYRTSDAQSDRNATTLRSPTATSSGHLLAGTYLKPFITPLGAPEAAGLSNFYSSIGGSASAPFSGPPPRPPAMSAPTSVEDPADIDTPGMIAADKNPNLNTPDLSLDVLPGESIDHARAHQDSDELPALPQLEDADQLHRAQAIALSPQGLPGTTHPAATTAVPAKPIPVNDDEEPVPISKMPVITPVRAPIANPYDILNR